MVDTKNVSDSQGAAPERLLWASASPAQRQMVKDHFEIPQSVYYEILPSPMLSIAKMLELNLPLEAPANNAPQPAQYFSMSAPDPMDKNSLARLRRLPLPAAKVVRKLKHDSRQARLDGYQSLLYSHLSSGVATCFPLWVLTYWDTLVDLKRDVRGPWIKRI